MGTDKECSSRAANDDHESVIHDIMSDSEWEQTKNVHRERRMTIMNEVHDMIVKVLKQPMDTEVYLLAV